MKKLLDGSTNPRKNDTDNGTERESEKPDIETKFERIVKAIITLGINQIFRWWRNRYG